MESRADPRRGQPRRRRAAGADRAGPGGAGRAHPLELRPALQPGRRAGRAICAIFRPRSPAINLQHGLLSHRAELIKTLEAEDGRVELRAVTGPDYGRIWDHELVAAVMKIAGNGTGDTRWKVPGVLDWATMTHNPFVDVTKDTTTLYASDRDVFLFLVDDTHPIEAGRLPNGDPDLYFRGFYCWNSEVGSKTLGIASFYLRAVCMNRNLWGVEGFEEISIRHSKFAAQRFAHEAAPALTNFARSSPAPFIAGVKAARERIVARKDEDRESLPAQARVQQSRDGESDRHGSGRRRPAAGERLRLRAGHHRARPHQAASGRATGTRGQGQERSWSAPPDHRDAMASRPRFSGAAASAVCVRGVSPKSERAALRLRDGLQVEREALGRPSRSNDHGKAGSENPV